MKRLRKWSIAPVLLRLDEPVFEPVECKYLWNSACQTRYEDYDLDNLVFMGEEYYHYKV